MQEISNIILLSDAAEDLEQGRSFYDRMQQGVGDYFFDSLIADIESLYLYAGVHTVRFGYYVLFAHRFPFALYYDVVDDQAVVVAVLDMRRNPAWVRNQLEGRGADA